MKDFKYKKEEAFDVLLDLDSHLVHGNLLNKETVEKLTILFPHCVYEGKGYRIIHSDIDQLCWDDNF